MTSKADVRVAAYISLQIRVNTNVDQFSDDCYLFCRREIEK
jgi:hypothetical protein